MSKDDSPVVFDCSHVGRKFDRIGTQLAYMGSSNAMTLVMYFIERYGQHRSEVDAYLQAPTDAQPVQEPDSNWEESDGEVHNSLANEESDLDDEYEPDEVGSGLLGAENIGIDALDSTIGGAVQAATLSRGESLFTKDFEAQLSKTKHGTSGSAPTGSKAATLEADGHQLICRSCALSKYESDVICPECGFGRWKAIDLADSDSETEAEPAAPSVGGKFSWGGGCEADGAVRTRLAQKLVPLSEADEKRLTAVANSKAEIVAEAHAATLSRSSFKRIVQGADWLNDEVSTIHC